MNNAHGYNVVVQLSCSFIPAYEPKTFSVHKPSLFSRQKPSLFSSQRIHAFHMRVIFIFSLYMYMYINNLSVFAFFVKKIDMMK